MVLHEYEINNKAQYILLDGYIGVIAYASFNSVIVASGYPKIDVCVVPLIYSGETLC